ncbi:hypothetical protein [Sphingopyxis flava]|uniref:DNA polymerase-1 n=1 Tax=Sphingopyxis flava TaxID=1507287 RepID=A0A1T5BRP0_9SPHN|nr:hypothetical protein [Sphingopyxis flava]SKB49583.1 DNA polymerase-1 [Sphingopyxis flava]
MSLTLLIDADLIAYVASAATQKAYDFGDTVAVWHDFEEAKTAADWEIQKIISRLDPDDVTLCFSDDFNSFRKDRIDPTYKGNRVGERPEELYPLKEWLKGTYESAYRPALEADDVMGIIATDPSRSDERIIVSADKDMMTIPGLLYRPQLDTDLRRKPPILTITPLEAIRFHFWQAIVGDQTDGYPGARGVGKLSPWAQDVLEAESEEEAWDEVLGAFSSVGLTEEDAVRQARLARILQHQDYDGTRPILWLPPYIPEVC